MGSFPRLEKRLAVNLMTALYRFVDVSEGKKRLAVNLMTALKQFVNVFANQERLLISGLGWDQKP